LEEAPFHGSLGGDILDATGGTHMDPNDTRQDGPEDPRPEGRRPEDEPTDATAERAGEPTEPTAERPPDEGPQAPATETATASAGGDARKRLTRSREDRVIGGVAGGLGRYFGVDPVFFRIGAIALAFVGGAGVLLYLAALLLMPSDDGAAAVAPGTQGRSRALVIAGVVVLLLVAWPFLLGGGILLAGVGIPLAILVGAGVLVWWLVSGEGPSGEPKEIARRAALGVGILILCCVVGLGGAFAAAAGPDWLVPAVVIAAGAAIFAGAFVKPVRWLVPPAVVLALAAGTVAAAGIDLDGGIGEREYAPTSTADLNDRYELGMGELVVDLRDTELPSGDVPLELDLGIGEARVIVPEDVCVATSADVGIGNVSFFGRDSDGVDVDFEETPEAVADGTRLVLDAEVGLGEVRVHDASGELEFEDRGFDDDPFQDREGLDLEGGDNSGCATTGERASG
jgi:phage shock protein PspC (stress-responsive transcriptional regulator)